MSEGKPDKKDVRARLRERLKKRASAAGDGGEPTPRSAPAGEAADAQATPSGGDRRARLRERLRKRKAAAATTGSEASTEEAAAATSDSGTAATAPKAPAPEAAKERGGDDRRARLRARLAARRHKGGSEGGEDTTPAPAASTPPAHARTLPAPPEVRALTAEQPVKQIAAAPPPKALPASSPPKELTAAAAPKQLTVAAPAPDVAAPAPAAKTVAPKPPAAPGRQAPATSVAPAKPQRRSSARAVARRRAQMRLGGRATADPAATAQRRATTAPRQQLRKHSPYLDDAVFERLPEQMRAALRAAGEDRPGRPVGRLLARLAGWERKRLSVLYEGFVEGMCAVLKPRFLPADLDKVIHLDTDGELTLRWGDGHVKVRARCWDLVFIEREGTPLTPNDPEAVDRALSGFVTFGLHHQGRAQVVRRQPVRFDDDTAASYLEAELEHGGWCARRFRAGACFTDGRITVLHLDPMLERTTSHPVPEPRLDPREVAQQLAAYRKQPKW
jgi:hypothetical protein